jgi:ATP-dependent exoDNAse (exonuclease V) beta subunit
MGNGIVAASTISALADYEMRRIALTAHDRTLLVEAGAGSGKTALLAGRIALMCAGGIPPGRITAITFTEAAASELRERIESYVMRLCENDIPNELRIGLPNGLSPEQHLALAAAIEAFDELTCTTIHGFCQRLIEPYPVEANTDPGAAIIENAARQFMQEEVVTEWLSGRFGRTRDGIEVPQAGEDDILAALIETGGVEMVHAMRVWARYMCEHPDAVPYLLDDASSAGSEFCDAVQAFEDWYHGLGLHEEKTAEYLISLRRTADFIDGTSADTPTQTELMQLLQLDRPSTCKKNDAQFLLYRVKGAWEKSAKAAGLPAARGSEFHAAGTDYYMQCAESYVRWSEHLADVACSRIVRSMSSLHEVYRSRKQRAAGLDFDDLLQYARNLVCNNAHVRVSLARRYPHILVDEFQDTDSLQAELLWRLCAQEDSGDWENLRLRPGSLFVVADPKQAIYRFRGADIATYIQAKSSLCKNSDGTLLQITTNFRSDDGILGFVNESFQPLLEVDGQPGFAALIPARKSDGKSIVLQRIAVDEHIEEAAQPGAKPSVADLRVAEARAVAQAVAILLAEMKIIDRRNNAVRACTPGDIALLSATGSSLWYYEREFDLLGIPIASQAGKGFFRRQEVHDLIALVRTLADDRDTTAFGALLRGPLVGMSELEIADAVLETLAADTRLSVRTSPACVSSPILRATLDVLKTLRDKVGTTTPYHIIAEAIERLNMRALLMLRLPRNVERALANVEHFLALARQYDVRGIFAFAQVLRELWKESERHEEGRLDQVKDAVLISTMHSSKGLEWPIVIPINSMTDLHSKSARIHYDRADHSVHFKVFDRAGSRFGVMAEAEKSQHAAEAVRLWYVALTRARDLLILPQITQRPSKDWLSVLGLDLNALPRIEGVPQRYTPENVQRPIAQDEATWTSQSARLDGLRRKVSFVYPSRTEDKADGLAQEYLLDELDTHDALSSDVQGGRERGNILHKLLEEVITGELEPQVARIVARSQEIYEQLIVDSEQFRIDANEIAACVLRTVNHNELKGIFPRLQAEVPLYFAQDSGVDITVTAGIADAVAIDSDGNCEMVIDWKSDVDPANSPIDDYVRQLKIYLQLTHAKSGMIVFVTTGRIVRLN